MVTSWGKSGGREESIILGKSEVSNDMPSVKNLKCLKIYQIKKRIRSRRRVYREYKHSSFRLLILRLRFSG